MNWNGYHNKTRMISLIFWVATMAIGIFIILLSHWKMCLILQRSKDCFRFCDRYLRYRIVNIIRLLEYYRNWCSYELIELYSNLSNFFRSYHWVIGLPSTSSLVKKLSPKHQEEVQETTLFIIKKTLDLEGKVDND